MPAALTFKGSQKPWLLKGQDDSIKNRLSLSTCPITQLFDAFQSEKKSNRIAVQCIGCKNMDDVEVIKL